MHRQHRQPLASLASLASAMFPDYAPPNPKPVSAVTFVEKQKQKIKITIVPKKTSVSTTSIPTTSVVAPAVAPAVAPSPTKKIKITIKKQPKEEQQQKYQEHHFDIAPPSSMFFKPYSDYIEPPPKCCRFFIENRHCFLRSTDNACIDKITKEVFGFWNCKIGTNSKLLLLPVGNDDVYEVCEEKEKEDLFCKSHEDDDDIKTRRAEMRKKSDANRARLTGQPIALLRQKIALKYGMQIRSVPSVPTK